MDNVSSVMHSGVWQAGRFVDSFTRPWRGRNVLHNPKDSPGNVRLRTLIGVGFFREVKAIESLDITT